MNLYKMTAKLLYPFLLLILCFHYSCFSSKKASEPVDELSTLKKYMTGSFNSAAQAAQDSNYYDITLHMYPIWEDLPGEWLYVEQAVTSNQDRPYRQRVYELRPAAGGIYESIVYTLKNPSQYVKAWEKEDAFKDFQRSDITLKDGCAVRLKAQSDGSYSGATGERSCPSELRGASYATSKVTVYKKRIVSWDQGFNAEGEQVWGATQGGYVFEKQ